MKPVWVEYRGYNFRVMKIADYYTADWDRPNRRGKGFRIEYLPGRPATKAAAIKEMKAHIDRYLAGAIVRDNPHDEELPGAVDSLVILGLIGGAGAGLGALAAPAGSRGWGALVGIVAFPALLTGLGWAATKL